MRFTSKERLIAFAVLSAVWGAYGFGYPQTDYFKFLCGGAVTAMSYCLGFVMGNRIAPAELDCGKGGGEIVSQGLLRESEVFGFLAWTHGLMHLIRHR